MCLHLPSAYCSWKVPYWFYKARPRTPVVIKGTSIKLVTTTNTLLRLQKCSSLTKHQQYPKGFAAAMSEALDKLDQQEAQMKVERTAKCEQVKDAKRQKRELKRRKWVDWNTQDEQSGDTKRPAFDPADRVKRKKSAILLGYCGANYFGMQRNPGMQTIEEELFKAMLKQKWITEESFEAAQAACFQRAARTDKGVSAARQVCSMKLPDPVDIKALNEDLPEQIRVFGVERVTKGFNAKDQCNARTYTYTLPSIAFADYTQKYGFDNYRIEAAQLQKIGDILKLYEGTKNFHNFTSRKNFLDPSAKRFIMSFSCSEPFLTPQGLEFLTLKVKGQSFMLHQIRKMVGLAIAIARGNTMTATLDRALTEERLDLPMAPGLGLVLDTVHYERYNDRYGSDGIHEPLTWVKQEDEIKEFIERYIYANIYETEYKERSMLEWLETLPLHSYDARRDDAQTAISNDESGKKHNDDDDE
ncbi:pseudouridylate synthase 1 homolog isoform X2 [Anastrepha ludens]|uniref:pseudouridylate synthase 1 homolog isoform X2 n=1 Tax=Anastrepha ludens TaxID=28586 RepID=UPI0023B02222|nr:pseudouridylate synthase 1 homolog isoform X2 [Anastrepha ludens]